MARRKRHEEHENHERWAIPYGDLVTLLLAFFVVMYSISQVSEGKYRVRVGLAERGLPRHADHGLRRCRSASTPPPRWPRRWCSCRRTQKLMALRQLAQQAEKAMAPLITQGLVDVSRGDGKLSIAIRSDILFGSGSLIAVHRCPAGNPAAGPGAGRTFRSTSRSRVTPTTCRWPVGNIASNWELSAARAVSVVHLLIQDGVPPGRLSAVGYGEFHPVVPNTTPDGRNANRRVVLTVEASDSAAGATSVAPDPAIATDLSPAGSGG